MIDSLEGDSARGDYGGTLPGAFRPLLSWTNDFTPQAAQDLPTDSLGVPLLPQPAMENEQ